jgi:pimeloyl-ACP methyl ester carboxylesterase
MGNPAALTHMRSEPWNFPNERPDIVFKVFEHLFGPLGEWDWRDKAASLKAPTLVVHGMEDLIPLASSREWVATLPCARLFTMAGIGHYPWIEDPASFFPAAERFLAGEWPQDAEQVH